MSLFELHIKEHRCMEMFVKTLSAICLQSDTALFKVKKGGIYIKLTDAHSFCCVEIRMVKSLNKFLHFNCVNGNEFSAKIRLDGLISTLRKVLQKKNIAIIYSDEHTVLKVREESSNPRKLENIHVIDSTEWRDRVFRNISSTLFQSRNHLKFKIVAAEFSKTITRCAIISGTNGGILNMTVNPVGKDEYDIKFIVSNQSGARNTSTIHANANDKTSLPILKGCTRSININVLLTYLVSARNLFSTQSEYVTCIINDQGLLLQTEEKNYHSTLIFVSDLEGINLQSYQ